LKCVNRSFAEIFWFFFVLFFRYTKLTDVADHFFPPLHKIPCSRASEFSHVQYWREPLPEVSPFEVDDVLSGKTAKQQEQENS
jgi:hypothetical protein